MMPAPAPTVHFLAIACLISFATNVTAAPPREQNSGNEAWETTIGTGDDEHVSVYCFLPDDVMVEIQKYPGKDGTVSTAFYEHKDGKLSIKWTRLRNQKLNHTSTEIGQLKKVGDGALSYKITDHTDKEQIGDQHDFKRVTLDDTTYSQLLKVASVYHQLKLKELDQQRLIDHYEDQVKQYEDAIQRLLK